MDESRGLQETDLADVYYLEIVLHFSQVACDWLLLLSGISYNLIIII